MAGVKITDLPILNTPNGDDLFYIVDVNGNTSNAITLNDLASALNNLLSFIPLRGTGSGTGEPVIGTVTFNVLEGGLLEVRYPNGDIFTFGVQFGAYSGISFYDSLANQTLWAYIRGGDLFLANETTSQFVSGVNAVINSLIISKLDFINNKNMSQSAFGTGNIIYRGTNGQTYLDNGDNTYKGYTLMPRHYFVDSCVYSQSGTNAPIQNSIFETQVGVNAITNKVLTRQGVGHYRIEYFEPMGTNYLPTDFSRIKVITSQGAEPHVNISYSFPGFTAVNVLAIDIFTRQPSSGNLVDSHLDNSVIEVYFYL